MSLLDFYGNVAQDQGLVWPGSNVSAYAHRTGAAYGNPWQCNNSSNFTKGYPPKSHIFYGYAMTCLAWTGYSGVFSDNRGTWHFAVVANATAIEVRRGSSGGAVMASAAWNPTVSNWYYFEVEATISDTVGICKVRVNGVTVIDFVGDTRNAGTSTDIDGLVFGQGGNYNTSVSDFYLCDDSGAAPFNTFLGDIRVARHRPTAAGASTQFTPDTGANYARVNETPYSAASYVSSATSGHKDSYAMDDLPVVGQVLAVKAAAIAKNGDGGTPQLRNLIRTASTDYLGPAANLGGSDTVVANTWTTNPNTSAAWTAAEVNALEVGMVRV